MAPKKKERVWTHLRINCPEKFPENNILQCDYSETILHRLRPRIRSLHGASETVNKVSASGITRRRRNRLAVKRCFVQYKRKRRYLENRNRVVPRSNSSKKSAGDFTSNNNVVAGPIQIAETNAVAKNNRKQTSLIRSIRDYIFSTLREGTKWAKEYVCRAFKSDNKSPKISSGTRRIEERNAISSSALRGIQPGQSDCRDKRRRRYKTANNQQQEQGNDLVSKFSENAAVTSDECTGNVSEDNPENFPAMSNGRHRHCTVIKNLAAGTCSRADDRSGNDLNKKGQTRSKSRRKRRKGVGASAPRIARNVMRSKRTNEIVSERHPHVVRSNDSAMTNLTKPNAAADLINIENVNDSSNKGEDNFSEKKEEIGIDEPNGSRGIIKFGKTVSSEKGEGMRCGKNKDKFSKPSTENNSLEKRQNH